MKNIFLLLIFISAMSCSKDIIEKDTSNYYLNFEITDNLYRPEDQKSYSVTSNQNMDFKLLFVDAYKSKHKYPYFGHDTSPTDSIDIIGTVRFESKNDFGFEEKFIDFEFVLREAAINLYSESDSTYTYKSNKTLYKKLRSHDFSQKNLFNTNDLSTIFISIPLPESNETSVFHSTDTSNGFYFEHEEINFIEANYNKRDDQIHLTGTFTVELKQLSCGFYSTHLLSDATFSLLIK